MDLRSRTFLVVTLAVALAAAAPAARAASVEVQMDNDTDVFVPGAGTDWDYTEGARLTWHAEPGAMPRWADRVASRMGGRDDERRFGFALGQEMYTPRAIEARSAVTNDRPYAGWLYASTFVSTRDVHRERSLELVAGAIGPSAQAGEVQTWWHQTLGIRLPRGWQYQLRNEPAFRARFQQRWRPAGYQRFADVVPYAGASLGNVQTDALVGATFRLGAALPDDFGPSAVSAPGPGEAGHRAHAYAFARVEGRYVVHSAFLDGNTFGPSLHAHRIPEVAEAQLGLGLRWRSVGLRYTVSYTSDQITERRAKQKYGSFALSF